MRARPSRRSWGSAAFTIIGVLVLAAALWLLAAGLTRWHLDQAGEVELGVLQSGHTPWQWRFTQPDDLIAGRVFGAASLRRADGALQVRSRSTHAVEVGFPLTQDADLIRAGRLHLDYTAAPGTRLTLRVMPALTGSSCSAALPDHGSTTWRMDTLPWRDAAGHPCPIPRRAALFRLGIQQPQGASFTLRAAQLLPSPDMQPLHPAQAHTLETHLQTARKQLRTWAGATAPTVWPMIRIPAHALPQQQLALRDLSWRQFPGAVVLGPDSRHAVTGHATSVPSWVVLAVYLLLILALEVHRHRHSAQAISHYIPDLLAALFGPMWLIVGLRLGPQLALPDIVTAATGFLYALRLAWIPVAGEWSWLGRWRHYPLPFALLIVLAGLLVIGGHAPNWPAPHQIVMYLGWALLQQWLMLTVVLRRLEGLFNRRTLAVLACATIFALMHTPNARLMLLCLLAELWWAWCFMRNRSVVPIALAHAVFALIVQASLSGGWLRSLEVGARYFMGPGKF